MDENDELFDEPEMPRSEEEEELPLMVWVNAGFGHRSYPCRINSDSTMTLPDPLVRELGLRPGDDVDMEFNEEDGTLYLSKKEQKWEAPEWLQD
jgi:hypothetical protein